MTRKSFYQVTEFTTIVLSQDTEDQYRVFKTYQDVDETLVSAPQYFNTLKAAEDKVEAMLCKMIEGIKI